MTTTPAFVRVKMVTRHQRPKTIVPSLMLEQWKRVQFHPHRTPVGLGALIYPGNAVKEDFVMKAIATMRKMPMVMRESIAISESLYKLLCRLLLNSCGSTMT